MNNTSVNIGAETAGFFGYTCIGHFVSNLVAAAFIVAGVVFFVYLVWGGVQYLMSGGDKTGIADAQKKIAAAFIGLFIVASSWAIYQIVIIFFGLNLNTLCTASPVG